MLVALSIRLQIGSFKDYRNLSKNCSWMREGVYFQETYTQCSSVKEMLMDSLFVGLTIFRTREFQIDFLATSTVVENKSFDA